MFRRAFLSAPLLLALGRKPKEGAEPPPAAGPPCEVCKKPAVYCVRDHHEIEPFGPWRCFRLSPKRFYCRDHARPGITFYRSGAIGTHPRFRKKILPPTVPIRDLLNSARALTR